MKRLSAALTVLLLIAPTAAAQDAKKSNGGPNGKPARDKLVAALNALDKKGEFVLDGKVSVLDSSGAEGGLVNTMVVVGNSTANNEFEGPIRAWHTSEDELIVFSKDKLPGFAFYDNGDRVVSRIFIEETPIDISRLSGEISGLLDPASLARYVKKAEFDSFLDRETKTTTLQGVLSRRLVKTSQGNDFQILPERVLHVEAEFVLDSRDRLESFTINVVRSDPMAGLKRKVLDGEISGGEVIKGMPEPSNDEGKCSVYAFKISKDKPTKEERAFLKEVQALLEGEDF